MDAANIKAVINRLTARGLTKVGRHSEDSRLLMVELTRKGETTIKSAIPSAIQITHDTLEPLTSKDQAAFLRLLKKLC
jgi:DNA-binding MarR family transcriptional regulator